MQEWIDICVARVLAEIGIPPVFISRGDLEFLDFGMMDFNQDGARHDLDLSGIVPANASAVSFWFDGFSGTLESTVTFMPGGHVHVPNSSVLIAQVVGILNMGDFVLPIGPDGKIQYFFLTPDWAFIGMFVKGWWL